MYLSGSVDFGEAALAQQANELVIAEAVVEISCHIYAPFHVRERAQGSPGSSYKIGFASKLLLVSLCRFYCRAFGLFVKRVVGCFELY